nr:AraC family transcriptional regulator [Terrimicrobiaceae bacterium]
LLPSPLAILPADLISVSLAPHHHPGAMEICFLVKGRQNYQVAGRDHRMRGGDVFFTFPGEWHSTGGLPQEKGSLYWLTLNLPSSGEPFLGLDARQANKLVSELLRLKVRLFRGDWTMKKLLDEVTFAHYERRSPLRVLYIANCINAFLLRMIACSRAASPTATSNLQEVLHFIEQNVEENLSVANLATRARLSLSRFKARFKEETGVPPAEYILRAKIDQAKNLLQTTTVTDTAYSLGFSSSQYFATVFKRFTRMRPSEYQAAEIA